MTRDQLAKDVSKELGISAEAARRVIDSVLDKMSQALVRGDRIELRNFGVFTVQEWAGRELTDPIRGKRMKVPTRRIIHFKTGLNLRKRLNKPKKKKK